MPTDHPFFSAFPAQPDRSTTRGRAPVPYVVRDGYGLLIAGTISGRAGTDLLGREKAVAVRTTEGRALAGMWVCDFTDANLGPHQELQFFVAATRTPLPDTSPHPLALLRLLLAEPALCLFCHGLWNTTNRVVAYNRELLGLDAHPARGEIGREPDPAATTFRFRAASGDLLVEGRVGDAGRTPAGVMWQSFGLLGPSLLRRAAPGRALAARIMNPRGVAFPDNRVAETYLSADRIVLQRWGDADAVRWSAEPYADADFRPTFLEHFSPYRFVYLEPR